MCARVESLWVNRETRSPFKELTFYRREIIRKCGRRDTDVREGPKGATTIVRTEASRGTGIWITEQLYAFAQAAIAKSHKLGGLKNRSELSPTSRG